MKTLIFYLVLLIVGTSQAQEFTELKEAKVGFSPMLSDVERNGNKFSFTIKESFVGEFEKDPLAFMESNFSLDGLISELKHEEYENYEVSFITQKGVLKADFDKEGNLVKSTSRFKNILLPTVVRHDLYRNYKGWAMTKNIHIYLSKKGTVEKNYYKINLENGKDRKRIIVQAPVEETEVAIN